MGTCPNNCQSIGDAYRKQQAAELKLRKTGAKIRSSYIAFAQKESKRLKDQVATLESQIAEKEKEVERLRDISERAEGMSQAALEHKRASGLYQTLEEHQRVIKGLKKEMEKHEKREKALGDILDALRSGYNPNYQDMAVLEAVRGWEQLAGLPHINDIDKTNDAPVAEEDEKKEEVGTEEAEEWTKDELEMRVNNLLNKDHTGLLLAYEEHISAPIEDSVRA